MVVGVLDRGVDRDEGARMDEDVGAGTVRGAFTEASFDFGFAGEIGVVKTGRKEAGEHLLEAARL